MIDRNALVTDGFLKVKNVNDVFGIGDCATVEFTKLMTQVKELYTEADKDGSGELNFDEFVGRSLVCVVYAVILFAFLLHTFYIFNVYCLNVYT